MHHRKLDRFPAGDSYYTQPRPERQTKIYQSPHTSINECSGAMGAGLCSALCPQTEGKLGKPSTTQAPTGDGIRDPSHVVD